jgi:hypothetical protein
MDLHLAEKVEKGRLADVGHPDDPSLEVGAGPGSMIARVSARERMGRGDEDPGERGRLQRQRDPRLGGAECSRAAAGWQGILPAQ